MRCSIINCHYVLCCSYRPSPCCSDLVFQEHSSWNHFLCREHWLTAARKVFEGLDGGSTGLTTTKLMQVLRAKLPSAEVDYAVEDALVDAGYKGKQHVFTHACSVQPCTHQCASGSKSMTRFSC